MPHPHPGQNEEAAVVSHEMQVPAAMLLRPADKTVPAADVPRRRGPCKAGDRAFACVYDIFQMFTHRVTVTQVMVTLDQTVEERFIFCISDLPHFKPAQPGK